MSTDCASGKVALITGSTSGIGLAIAHSLAKRGVNIIVSGSRDGSLVNNILNEIRSYGVRADYIPCDLSKLSNIEAMWKKVIRLYSDGIDILINNAAVLTHSDVEHFPDDKWEEIIAVNLSAPFHLIKRSLPGMREKGWGRIINMSSVAGFMTIPEYGGYSTTKHALHGLTKAVALENTQHGIMCTSINPAFVETPMQHSCFDRVAHVAGLSEPDAAKACLAHQPTGKLIEPEQVAELVEFVCLSKASSQMTGASYLIDGGWMAL